MISCVASQVNRKKNKSTSTFSNGNPETSFWNSSYYFVVVHKLEDNIPSYSPTSKIFRGKTSSDDDIVGPHQSTGSSRTSAMTAVKPSDLQARLSSEIEPSGLRGEAIFSASPKDTPDPPGTKGVGKRVVRCSSDPVAVTSLATFPYHVVPCYIRKSGKCHTCRREECRREVAQRFWLRAIHLIGAVGYKCMIRLEDGRI
ncbi:hypothetical protein EDB86DRAFT_564391 [Lactarius hatsudake]|nr:hypothetical protein EDB86DRAFT_564391 [Lactarius hatsudake]